ncbi:hypothetical protein BLA29_012986 [Euroglyphus maynei]|uniref:Uncharacterized protein n=1 Tax=Euroglyphus maynei TaxID=6958 RepID=A0A1Y3BRH6_EURMA|nr:hypothetical protein BLA29_012986 [Euroglyphus maynei]
MKHCKELWIYWPIYWIH